MMNFTETKLKGSYSVDIIPFVDERGWFVRTFCKNDFREIGFTKEWVQINHSFTAKEGTIRGMHFQYPPFAEIKLVRCISGKIFEVIVDLRKGSDTFLEWVGVELSAENKKMMFIPEGFAHGFQTLTDDTQLIYHHTNIYKPESEGGFTHDDSMINIKWPLEVSCISGRDKMLPPLTNNFEGLILTK